MQTLFRDNLKRLDILKIKPKHYDNVVKIAVHRNHSFETIGRTLNAFLEFSAITSETIYSDYDDSFNFNILNADIHIVWADLNRYNTMDLQSFFEERLNFLRANTNKPILFLYLSESKIFNYSILDCYCFNIYDWISKLKEKAYDIDKEPISGTRLSNDAALLISQKLGLSILPAVIMPTLKAIVCDLDNTLYNGILGEDGIENLKLTAEHLSIQKYIKNLKEKGFFICIASKNNENDVFELLEKRKDFVLRKDDFTIIKSNWQDKSENIKEIVQKLNIGYDSILFIDDNIAEIENVKNILPIKTLHAIDPETTLTSLKLYPGLLKLHKSNEDSLRSADIKANFIRSEYSKSLSNEEYFKKLNIKLLFSINENEQIVRITELFNKTNQFIFNYQRYSQAQVEEIMKKNNSLIINVRMSDKLSDSGIVALMSARKSENVLIVDELTISCRALGRKLEDIMILYMFKLAKEHLNTGDTTIINYKKGDRNTPAQVWLEKFIGKNLVNDFEHITHIIPKNIQTEGVEIEVNYGKIKI